MGGCVSRDDSKIQYSVEVGPDLPNGTKEIRNPKFQNSYLYSSFPDVSNLQELYLRSFSLFAKKKFLGVRVEQKYEWKTYEDIGVLSSQFGSGLISRKVCKESSQDGYQVRFLALYLKNCEQWHIADMACGQYGITSVPLYDTLGVSSIEFILSETETKTILLSNDKIDLILSLKSENKTHSLKYLITVSPVDESTKGKIREHGLKVFSFQDILEYGKENKVDYPKIDKDSIYTLSYTSGTTGNPKGVVMTHKAIIAQVSSAQEFLQPTSEDIHICFLPLAHVYERCASNCMISVGARIGYYSGDVLKLKEDLAVLRPTILICVPRLLNRFYDLIRANISAQTGLKAKLIEKGLRVKLENARGSADYTHGFYDGLVFSKIKKILGGRVRIGTTASAPIAGDVLTFLRVVFCCPIIEAYGQTENGGAATATYSKDPETGHVGGPVGAISLRLVDVPEMNYVSTHRNEKMELCPRGEVCMKGPSIMPRYFKNDKITGETIDEDGWLHSGDIGELRPNGSIKIIDRKKNIFKLAQGEYIAPEKLENIYIQSQYVAFVFVYGDSLQSYIIGIIVPERTTVEKLGQSLGLSDSWEELCRSDQVKSFIIDDLARLGKENNLNGMEIVKKVYLHPDPITPETNLVTPTFKIKRFDMKNHFKSEIDLLYSS